MIAAIQWSQIGKVIWVSLVAGIFVTALFSLIVYCSSRAAEARRAGGNPTVFGVLATGGTIAFFGVIALAILVILKK